MKMLRKASIAAVLALATFACQNALLPDPKPVAALDAERAWQEYLSTEAARMPDGTYIVERDIRIPDEASLKEYFMDVRYPEIAEALGSKSTVMTQGRYRTKVILSKSVRYDITYSISDEFGSRKAAIKRYMDAAVKGWEGACNIKFRYVSSEDDEAYPNVYIPIRPATDEEEQWCYDNEYYIVASTFFPNYPAAEREFILFDRAFSAGEDPGYLFRHELGHILGLRHEHIWFGSWTGETTQDAMLLTTRDSASIMYYPDLPKYTGDGRGTLTSRDVQGVQKLYGKPVR